MSIAAMHCGLFPAIESERFGAFEGCLAKAPGHPYRSKARKSHLCSWTDAWILAMLLPRGRDGPRCKPDRWAAELDTRALFGRFKAINLRGYA